MYSIALRNGIIKNRLEAKRQVLKCKWSNVLLHFVFSMYKASCRVFEHAGQSPPWACIRFESERPRWLMLSVSLWKAFSAPPLYAYYNSVMTGYSAHDAFHIGMKPIECILYVVHPRQWQIWLAGIHAAGQWRATTRSFYHQSVSHAFLPSRSERTALLDKKTGKRTHLPFSLKYWQTNKYLSSSGPYTAAHGWLTHPIKLGFLDACGDAWRACPCSFHTFLSLLLHFSPDDDA